MTDSESDSIEIETPSDLYEHLKFLQPNIYIEERHDEENRPTIKLRLKRYDTYTEKTINNTEYTQEAEHNVQSQAERLQGYLVGDWGCSVTGEEIGADMELELCLIPPESVL